MKTNSLEFRLMQRERILNNKPWNKSTGPRTIEGKKISSLNSCGSNYKLNQLISQYLGIMKAQKELHSMIQI